MLAPTPINVPQRTREEPCLNGASHIRQFVSGICGLGGAFSDVGVAFPVVSEARCEGATMAGCCRPQSPHANEPYSVPRTYPTRSVVPHAPPDGPPALVRPLAQLGTARST